MRLSLPRRIIRTVQRAVVEFEMIKPGDRILIGLSGGKDSSLLLYTLAVLVKHLPFSVTLGAITFDPGFKRQEETDFGPLQEMCAALEIPYHLARAEIADEILNNNKQTPCARCSYFRRAIIHNYAKEQGYNKVALAHHLDDAVETFLMSIIYSGQISTFLPKTYLDRTEVTVIRPLVYLRETEIKSAVKRLGLSVVANPCPLDGDTKRREAKELIRELKRKNPNVFYHLAAAMREGRNIQLWPQEPTKEMIRGKSQHFWDMRQQ